jgi:hypothetical protein
MQEGVDGGGMMMMTEASVVCGRWMQLYRDLACCYWGREARGQEVNFSNKYERSLDFIPAPLACGFLTLIEF